VKTHSSVDILRLGLPDSVVAGQRGEVRRGRISPFPIVGHPENERDQEDFAVLLSSRRETAWNASSRTIRGLAKSAWAGVFRHPQHSTVMIYPLFLTCSRQGGEPHPRPFRRRVSPVQRVDTGSYGSKRVRTQTTFAPFKCYSSIIIQCRKRWYTNVLSLDPVPKESIMYDGCSLRPPFKNLSLICCRWLKRTSFWSIIFTRPQAGGSFNMLDGLYV